MTPARFETWLKARRASVERGLSRAASAAALGTPELAEAVRYSLLGGGKRLRPVLVLAGAEACGAPSRSALAAACAFEMVHTYSLIHDDLPAMDDDDLRRGRPTSHKVYGEAMAILAGDALLTHAFLTLADAYEPRRAKALTALLARASGPAGMVGGQVLDIQPVKGHKRLDAETLLARIHKMKTGALITASAEAGAVVAGAAAAKRRALREFGSKLGLAFQIVDDINDAGGDAGRLTWPSLHGLDRSRTEAARLIAAARRSLKTFGGRAAALDAIAAKVLAAGQGRP